MASLQERRERSPRPREHKAWYTKWMNNVGALLKPDHFHPYRPYFRPPQANRSLTIFCSRKKRSFFTANYPCELDLSSDVLGLFHPPTISSDTLNDPPNRNSSAPSGAPYPHPDPAVTQSRRESVQGRPER